MTQTNIGKNLFCKILAIVQISFFFVSIADAKESSHKQVIENALEQFNVPGAAVAVVKEKEVLVASGFGLANIDKQQVVTTKSLFRIASLSKAFTASALAVLVDENKIDWQDKVIDYIPEFRLKAPLDAQQVKIIDLLTHKSGLSSGAGDSMIWPAPSTFTSSEIINNLRYLSPQYDFREKYAYSNVMYIVAGEIIERVSGQSFDEFLQTNIFKPLKMKCFAGDIPKPNLAHTAKAYGYNDALGTFEIKRNSIKEKGLVSAPAGAIVCDLDSMILWSQAMNNNNKKILSESQFSTLFTPQTNLKPSKQEREWNGAMFKQYALGWRVSNVGKYLSYSHTGTISGYQSYMLLVPELELSFIILTNGSNSAARGSIMQTLLQYYLPQDAFDSEQAIDWVSRYEEYLAERERRYLANLQEPKSLSPMSINDNQILGMYSDTWFGQFEITKQNSLLHIQFEKMPSLKGKLIAFQDNVYKIEWFNKDVANDVLIVFELDLTRKVSAAKILPFTLKHRPNHNFKDMYFAKQK